MARKIYYVYPTGQGSKLVEVHERDVESWWDNLPADKQRRIREKAIEDMKEFENHVEPPTGPKAALEFSKAYMSEERGAVNVSPWWGKESMSAYFQRVGGTYYDPETGEKIHNTGPEGGKRSTETE